jgi:hypothetical protein
VAPAQLFTGGDGTSAPTPRVLGPGLRHADTTCVPERRDVEFGSTSYDWAYDTAAADDGSVFVAGYSYGLMPNQLDSTATYTGFVTKVDPSGEVAWSYRTGYSAESVAVDPAGNAYVLDYDGSGTQALKKLSPSGAVVWTMPVRPSGTNGWLNKLAASDDGVYVAGYDYTYAYDYYSYYYYYYTYVPRLVKVGFDGTLAWSNTYPSGSGNTYEYDVPQALSVNSEGRALLASNASSWNTSARARLLSVAPNGTQIARSFISGHDYLSLYDVAVGDDGSVAGVGWTQDLVSCSYYDYYYYYTYCNYEYGTFAARYDSNWSELWSHKSNTLASSSANLSHVALDSQGAVIASGNYAGVLSGETSSPPAGSGAFAVKYKPNGDLAWVHNASEPDDVRYRYEAALAVSSSDDVYVAGAVYSSDWTSTNVFVVTVGDSKP